MHYFLGEFLKSNTKVPRLILNINIVSACSVTLTYYVVSNHPGLSITDQLPYSCILKIIGFYCVIILRPQITYSVCTPYVGYLQCDTSGRDTLLHDSYKARTAQTSFCLCLTLVRLGPLGLLILAPLLA